MSETCSAGPGARPLGLADGLALAAAPTFAVMALLSGLGADPATMLCTAAQPSPLSGMTAMYLLMSVFHAGPWLKRLGAERARRA